MNKPILAVGTATTLAVSILVGCKAPVGTAPVASGAAEVSVDKAQAKSAVDASAIFTALPKVEKSEASDGMAHVRVGINIKDESVGPRFRIQALPGTWTEAQVTLFSSTANTTYNPAIHSVTIPFASFSGSPLGATASFPPLRPATDYTARAFLKNTAGAISTLRLAGSQVNTALTLNAGANTVLFNISVNGNEATYNVATGSSTNNNVVTGNTITKDDTVTLNTGIVANQPGVDRVDIKISGAAYGNPGTPVLIKRFTNAMAASWNTYVWDTSAANTADTANYNPATLAGGTGVTTAAGQLDVEAYNSNNDLVGKASFAISVHGRPTVTVQVQ